MALILELPWPSRVLHPNARSHYMAKAKVAKKARSDAAWIAKAAGVSKMDAKALSITATFCPPDNRRRDLDSMLASMKSAFDGIADVVGVDDSTWSFTIRRSDPVKRGVVRVSIEAAA